MSHRGPCKNRSKLWFLVKWKNYEKQTWVEWSKARSLKCLVEYLSKTPELVYLIPHLAQYHDTAALIAAVKFFAFTTTDEVTGLPLKYQTLRKGEDAEEWQQAHIEEFHRLISGKKL